MKNKTAHKIEGLTLNEERALYGNRDLEVIKCRFDGPTDGESALKECRNIRTQNCYFNLRYPFWHDVNLEIAECELTPLCRAALWYSENVSIQNSKLHGIKALRECAEVKMTGCDIVSPEFVWSVRGIEMTGCSAESEYFMMRSERLSFDNVRLRGKYSFQYITDSVFTNCEFDTKDAFWHAKNVIVKDSVIKGEYLAWYCENVTFENCTIIGTQPLCYCRGLRLINCRMINCDLAFEKSDAEATILSSVDSIKNPRSGIITALSVGEVILDDPEAKGRIFSDGKEISAHSIN